MPELLLDGRPVSVPDGATLLDAARSLGIPVPTLCFADGLRHHTSCMVCLVEDAEDGRLVPACATPASEGRRLRTGGERVLAARRRAVELLLSEHAGDCAAPCTRACPAHPDIPGTIRRLAAGDLSGALATLMEHLPLSWALAYACPAPCRRACRRRLVDRGVDICAIKRAASEAGLGGGAPYTPPARAPTGKRVAIVGAGPAGLSAAYFLARAGHRCVVLDERAEPGGMLREAVGPDRLPPEVLLNDIAVLRRLGVELLMGQAVTPERLDELRAGCDALVLAAGSAERLDALLPQGTRVDPATGASTLPGVFVGGNAACEPPTRLSVRAVAEGRKVARSVGQLLAGCAPAPEQRSFDSHRGHLRPEDLATLASRARRKTARGEHPSVAEALRCLDCDCARKSTCRLRRLASEVGAEAHRFPDEDGQRLELVAGLGGLSLEPGKCIKCGICVRIADARGDRPGLAFSGRGSSVRVRVPFDGDIGAAVASAAAECVARCPTGALAWDRRAGEGG